MTYSIYDGMIDAAYIYNSFIVSGLTYAVYITITWWHDIIIYNSHIVGGRT